MTNANDFAARTDSETIERALAQLDGDRTLLIPPRVSGIEPERDWWLLDRAILLESDTTVVLRNCKISCPTEPGTTSSARPTAASASRTRRLRRTSTSAARAPVRWMARIIPGLRGIPASSSTRLAPMSRPTSRG